MQNITNKGSDALLGVFAIFESLVPEPSCDLNHLLVQLVFEKMEFPQASSLITQIIEVRM